MKIVMRSRKVSVCVSVWVGGYEDSDEVQEGECVCVSVCECVCV